MKQNRSRERGKQFDLRIAAGAGLLAAGIVCGAFFLYASRQWNGKDRFTVVMTNPGVEIASFDPVSGKGIKLQMPGNLEIESVGGRGVWMAEMLPRLGQKYGWKWVGESVADYLGIGFTAIDRQMGWWDKWQWWRLTSNIEWKEVTLDMPLVEEVRSADGVVGLKTTPAWDDRAREWFTSAGIANEGVGVTVVNTTSTTGLGSHAARQIESSGMQVVMLANDTENISGCQIQTTIQLKDSLSAQYLQRVFGCRRINAVLNDGEIVLKLGQDYQKWWLGEAGKR